MQGRVSASQAAVSGLIPDNANQCQASIVRILGYY